MSHTIRPHVRAKTRTRPKRVYAARLPPPASRRGDPWRVTRLVFGWVSLATAVVFVVPHLLAGGMSQHQLLLTPLQHLAFTLGGLFGIAGFIALIWR